MFFDEGRSNFSDNLNSNKIHRNRQSSGLLPEGAQYRNGTCMTTPECTAKGGATSGSCAGG